VPWHRVNLYFNTRLAEGPRALVDPSGWRPRGSRLQVFSSPDGRLRVAEDSHSLHSVCLQRVSLSDRLSECKSDWSQLCMVDPHSSSASVTAESHPAVAVHTYRSGSHSAVVGSRSVRPPHPDPCTHFVFSLSPAHRIASLLAAASSPSMTVFTVGSSSGSGHHMVAASRPNSCSFLMTVYRCA